MRISIRQFFPFRPSRPGGGGGFTLPELMVAMTVMLFLVAGVVFAHLYGLSMFRITETTLSATDSARNVAGKLGNEIRTSRSLLLGNVNNGVFEALLDGQRQEGGALLIHPSTDATNFVLYFVNPADETFRRTTGQPGSAVILAESVTNTIVFRAQDHLGRMLTNNQNNRVIHINLEFHQPRRYLQVAEYFKLQTSVTRRALE